MANYLKFSNGISMPLLGLGTWTSPVAQMKAAVSAALECGYRLIDCAFVYGNEKDIGEILEDCMKKGNIKREEIFITSKCWCTYMRPDLVKKCCERSVTDLRLKYIDLYLIHWPVALKPGDDNFPKGPDGNVLGDDTPLVDTWKAMEKLVDDGFVKSIGLSNFNKRQIDMILSNCRIRPVNLQVEVHANFPNKQLVEYAQQHNITVTAYAPLGSPGASPGLTNILTDAWVVEIANRHKKTTAQVLMRYLLQRGIAVVPKSVTPSRIKENEDLFDFELTKKDMQALDTNGVNKRQFILSDLQHMKEYPYNEEF